MTIRVGVVSGPAGGWARTVCAAVAADPELELVAAVDPHGAGRDRRGRSRSPPSREAFADAGAEVVVDFTVAAAARTTVPWLAMHGIHAVVGTTGLTDDDLATFRSEFGGDGPNCVVAANFAISAVLMMRFAELAAPYFDTAEIIELHHDAQDRRAVRHRAGDGRRGWPRRRREWAPDPTADRGRSPGARGGAGPAGIRVHSVRMRGMVAHQEVILGAAGQTLTIRQDSYDRASFMPGVLLACKRVADHSRASTVGLDALLGLVTPRVRTGRWPATSIRAADLGEVGEALGGGGAGVDRGRGSSPAAWWRRTSRPRTPRRARPGAGR